VQAGRQAGSQREMCERNDRCRELKRTVTRLNESTTATAWLGLECARGQQFCRRVGGGGGGGGAVIHVTSQLGTTRLYVRYGTSYVDRRFD